MRKIKLCDMEQQKVDMFMMANISNFQEDKALIIREKLLNESDDRWAMISSVQFKSPITALILSIFLGSIGVDRFLYRFDRYGNRQVDNVWRLWNMDNR